MKRIRNTGLTMLPARALHTMGAGLDLYGRRKDGSEFPVDVMLGPVKAGENEMVLSVIGDLTEKKDAEEKLCAVSDRKSVISKRS